MRASAFHCVAAASSQHVRCVSAFLLLAAVFLLAGTGPAHAAEKPAAKRPNILWISCEDISPHLGCYGDEYATTPHIDGLAGEGAVFTRCFSHAGVCAIARSGLITGVYPVSIGSQHMRSRIVPPPHIRCFTEYLRAAGYWCTNRAKTDYNFEPPLTAWDENSSNSRDWRGRAPGQPFFSVINLTVSHESRIRSKFDELQHDPAKVQLPPYIPDTPAARRDRARYYDIITLMDQQAGKILADLKADGLADETIVLFWGDHGEGLPRGKRWIYDSGIHVPLVVRWPGRIQPKTTRDDLVCFLDFAPTMLSLAGVPVPESMHGQVILGEHTAPPREYIFAHRDRMDETYDLIRAVRDQRYKYIRNFMPRRSYGQNIDYMNKMPTLQDMRRLHAVGELKGPEQLYFLPRKPVEELYDLAADPFEIHNIAADPAHRETLSRLRTVLETWQVEIGDLGLVPEPLLMEAMRPDSKYEVTARPVAQVREEAGAKAAQVTLTCPTEGASIAWTTEPGKNPHWKLYHQPVTVPAGTALRAVACRIGFRDSQPVTVETASTP
ncbi:MAG: sulfatase-like hydrolase/transferase [Planctomycetaceae bacterium]|nr:sulfatase-like hydrolase/transferase [Planctomycetaceae bacterium]